MFPNIEYLYSFGIIRCIYYIDRGILIVAASMFIYLNFLVISESTLNWNEFVQLYMCLLNTS